MKTTLAALAAAILLAAGMAAPAAAQGRRGGGPPAATAPVGPKGTIYELTIPKQGKMIADAVFYCWVPANVTTLRSVIVHLHGCTRDGDAPLMVQDLQWKALAKKWDSVFVAPKFTTGTNQTCSNWYIPDNGSEKVFLELLDVLAQAAPDILKSRPSPGPCGAIPAGRYGSRP